jgi:hypothetical protein
LSAQEGTVKAPAGTFLGGPSPWPVHPVEDRQVYHAADESESYILKTPISRNTWINLANKAEHEETKKRLARMIPANQHPGLKVQTWFDKFQK